MAGGIQGAPPSPVKVVSRPGIQRDGTRLMSDAYLDGQWVRFDSYTGLPRKINGYRMLTSSLGGVSRGMHAWYHGGITYIHTGTSGGLELVRIASNGAVMPPTTRTPATMTSDTNHTWQYSSIQDTISGEMKILAHAAPNALDIDNDEEFNVFVGKLDDTAALVNVTYDNTAGGGTATDPVKASGGIAVFHPYAFVMSSGGLVWWSVANAPTQFHQSGSGTARITAAKIIAGRATRSNSGPSGLFWSLDTLVRATFTGGATVWQFDELASIDIISAKSIVEYNGIFFWIGNGRFQMFSGVVRDVPNGMNRRWFFKNLNWDYRGRVFGWAVPTEGEIWWAFPKGDSTECNHAIVYNVNSGFWYDTPLPGSGRSAATSPTGVYRFPLLSGIDAISNQYKLWRHEDEGNYDEVDGSSVRAIKSSYTTNDITLLKGENPQSEKSVSLLSLEPDFIQSGDLNVTVIGNANSRSEDIEHPEVVIPQEVAIPAHEVVEVRGEHRQVRFRITSNEAGGNYEGGLSHVHVQSGGGRITT